MTIAYTYYNDGEALYTKLLEHKIGYDVESMKETEAQKAAEENQNYFCKTTMCANCPLYFTRTVSQCVSIYTNLRKFHHESLLTRHPELFL